MHRQQLFNLIYSEIGGFVKGTLNFLVCKLLSFSLSFRALFYEKFFLVWLCLLFALISGVCPISNILANEAIKGLRIISLAQQAIES
ncbi:hypothetical protein DB48_06650 [Shewanella sp. cp20]|nr:hypothetical protein DB48_06650 [Shewanella sp. cp20]